MAARSAPAVTAVRDALARSAASVKDADLPAALPTDALDDRIAIVGTAGSGKTPAFAGAGSMRRKALSSGCWRPGRGLRSWIRLGSEGPSA
jgi:hypothetical protein